MIELSKYLELKSIGKRALYYQVEQEKIFAKKVGGVIFIIDPEITMSSEARLTLKQEAKKEIEAMLLRAHSIRQSAIKESKDSIKKTPHNKQVTEIVSAIQTRVKLWLSKGVQLRGYSPQACYRKIDDTNKLTRQKRCDLHILKNPILVKEEACKKLEYLAKELYFQDMTKEPSIRLVCKRIVMYAQAKEEFYELAAIPFSTLYDNVTKMKERYGWFHKHLHDNNHSDFDRKRPWVLGAFTADIDFMDWYAMDDHVMEVDGAFVYNEVKQTWEKKKVYSWTVIEVKTLNIIAYAIQPDHFNADDIRTLMAQAITSMGRPGKGILMDNGLASSNKCQEFLDRLKINHDPGEAYNPMHKAVQERLFGFIKNEFCAQWTNYIGGGRAEVRHTTKKMSPEDCTYTVQEFISKFDDYIEGFYQTNIRTRKDKYKSVEICIREDFENRYLIYDKQHVSPVDLRKAYMQTTVKFFGYQTLAWGDKGLFNPDVNNTLHAVLCDRYYLCYFNPLDLSAIDIYAMEDILIQETGQYYCEGDFVATLLNQVAMAPADKRKVTAVHRKRFNKSIREMSEATVDLAIAECDVHAFSPELNQKGQLIDTRKDLEAKVTMQIEDAANIAMQVTVPEFKRRGRKAEEPEPDILDQTQDEELTRIAEEHND